MYTRAYIYRYNAIYVCVGFGNLFGLTRLKGKRASAFERVQKCARLAMDTHGLVGSRKIVRVHVRAHVSRRHEGFRAVQKAQPR